MEHNKNMKTDESWLDFIYFSKIHSGPLCVNPLALHVDQQTNQSALAFHVLHSG